MELNLGKILINLARSLLVIITIYLIYQADFLFAFVAFVASAISLLPILIEANYKLTIPWFVEFMIIFVLALNILGSFLDWFNSFIFFSSLMHFLGTAVISLLAFIIIYTLNLTKYVKLSIFMIGFFTFIFALAMGALWEIAEFSIDQTLGTNLQKDYGLDPIVDTMWDLIWDAVAGLFVAIIGSNLMIKYHGLVHPFEKHFRKLKTKYKKYRTKLKKRFKKKIKK